MNQREKQGYDQTEDGEERKQEAANAACGECEAQYYYGNVHHHYCLEQ